MTREYFKNSTYHFEGNRINTKSKVYHGLGETINYGCEEITLENYKIYSEKDKKPGIEYIQVDDDCGSGSMGKNTIILRKSTWLNT